MKVSRWRGDVLFVAKLLVAILAVMSIACFFLWNDPLFWARGLLKALGVG